MIRSMTGYGTAERTTDAVRVVVEVRSVNNRYFKANLRLPEGLGGLEARIERLLRERISRGTVTVNVTVEPRGAAARVPVNTDLLEAYRRDLERSAPAVSDDALLALPGVVAEEEGRLTGIENLPEEVEAAVREGLEQLNRMRDVEGRATADDMAAVLDGIDRRAAAIGQRAPQVVEEYRRRLQERVQMMLEGVEIAPDDQTLARELAFFAERADVNEELARLASHVQQFRELFEATGPVGRRAEFIAQEMYREVNTIGSKANDPAVAREAVEIKVGVDRLREQAQNIE
ncbi:MAG: YicC/YloC family endoribonuclease [Planctomycetota bacterium]|nr:YicC/YloC family endoribonuclease [Planctomycetota bacterium]